VKDRGAFIGPFLGVLDPEGEGSAVLGFTGHHSPKRQIVKTISTDKRK